MHVFLVVVVAVCGRVSSSGSSCTAQVMTAVHTKTTTITTRITTRKRQVVIVAVFVGFGTLSASRKTCIFFYQPFLADREREESREREGNREREASYRGRGSYRGMQVRECKQNGELNNFKC